MALTWGPQRRGSGIDEGSTEMGEVALTWVHREGKWHRLGVHREGKVALTWSPQRGVALTWVHREGVVALILGLYSIERGKWY